jgi:hypothetical protein
MSEINYKLLTDIIFMNDTTFTDIDIKNAKIIAHTCKLAKFNKNIQLSFDNFKIDKYYKQVIYLSEKKTVRHIEKYEIPLDVQLGAMDLDINIKYKEKIYNIIINLLKENVYVIEGVKEKMLIEQINNIEKFNSKIKIIFDIIYKIENDLIENDIEHYEIKTNIANIMTIFKYNSYFINMLSINLVNEKAVIDFISSKYFAKNWFKIPIIFPKSLLEKISLNLLYQ